ncbi:LuxR C-terminal-related transcriptional regulator [Cnuibacter physcomitrellae]|nr:LuxR C-terminal-related transcriptional regulator [Cnuibacter physcomitrellae]
MAGLHRLTLTEPQLDAVETRFGGWCAGVAWVMPLLEQAANREEQLARLVHDGRAIGEMLTAELLAGCDEDDEQLLLDAAVDRSVPASLVSELAGRADAMSRLWRLAHRVTMISVDDDGVRFDPVVFEVLQAEARRRNRARVLTAHGVAARWYARHGEPGQALSHAARTGDQTVMASFVDRFALDLVLAGERDDVLRLLEATDREDPPLSVLVTRLLIEVPYPDAIRAGHLFDAAETAASATAYSPWHVLLAALERFRPPIPGAGSASRPLVPLNDGEAREMRRRSLPVDLVCLGAEAWEQERAGNARDAIRLLDAVAESARSAGLAWLYLQVAELAVTVAVRSGDWDRARVLEDDLASFAERPQPGLLGRVRDGAAIVRAARRYQQALPVDDDELSRVISGDRNSAATGLRVPAQMMRLLPRLDEPADAGRAVETVTELLRHSGRRYPRLVGCSLLRLVDHYVAAGDRDTAEDVTAFAADVLGAGALELDLARHILAGRDESTAAALLAALERSHRAWHPGAPVGAWLLLAESTSLAQGGLRHRYLAKAVSSSRRHRTIRPFLARSFAGARLLAEAPPASRTDSWSALILERTSGWTDAISSTPPLTLTARELDVLQDLPTHHGIAAIAARHHLSVNTVKTHLRSIYLKLDVNDRSGAVDRARREGIL